MAELPDLLLIEPLPEAIESQLAQRFTLHRFTNLEALEPVAGTIRAIATGGSYGVDPDIMAALPALEIIAVNGVGLDRIDLEEAKRRNIRVTVTTDISTNDVADTAMMLLLTLQRRFSANERYLRSGKWSTDGMPPLAHSLSDKKMGIAGFGRIGQAIARRALASNMDVTYFNSRPRSESNLSFVPDLQKLAQWADVLVVSLPAGPRSANLISGDVLEALGPQGVLINVARGSIVDEEALLAALKHGTIAGAGLDVFQNEPNIHPDFFTLENTALQPHQGSGTIETRLKMGQNVVDNLFAQLDGDELLTPAF